MKYKHLNKTFTEVEEKKYFNTRPFRISKSFAYLMVAIFASFILFSAPGIKF